MLITGASSGFGRSIAQELAPSRRLVLVGRNAEKLEAVRNACETPERHLVWVRDLSQINDLAEELVSFLSANDIVIDHFIHLAGIISVQYARAFEMALATRLFNVNLFRRWRLSGRY